MSHVKVFSGSEIMAQALKAKLNDEGIAAMIKNNIQGGTVAGFGTLGLSVDVYVEQEDVIEAMQVVEELNS